MKSHTFFKFRNFTFITLLVISGSSIIGATPAFSQNTFPANGNVGIGTLTPVTRLEVVQSNGGALVGKFRNAATNNDRTALIDIQNGNGVLWRYGVGGTNNGLGINNGQFYVERLGVGALITIDQNGNTGIGTTAPQQRLHVVGNEILSTGSVSGFKFRNRGSNSSDDDWVW
ncbi:MAG: hypothetical protein M3142_04775, partial [Bacteroidota bacterium]|nr:hypothetical protein [Bacteroidota bacterium]